MPAYYAWIIVGFSDIVACTFLILTLKAWKILKFDLYVIISAHLVVAIIQSLYFITVSCWHFKKAYFNESEESTPFECFQRIGFQVNHIFSLTNRL